MDNFEEIKYPSDLIDLKELFLILDNLNYRIKNIESFLKEDFPRFKK